MPGKVRPVEAAQAIERQSVADGPSQCALRRGQNTAAAAKLKKCNTLTKYRESAKVVASFCEFFFRICVWQSANI